MNDINRLMSCVVRILALVRSSCLSDPEALRAAAVAAVRAAVTGSEGQAQDARERAAQALMRAQNISIEQARDQIGQYEQQYRAAVARAKEQAVQTTDATARVISRGALLGFMGLVLGAVASWFGGVAGTVLPIVTVGGPRRRH
jgi:Flp pilus assembly protein TadG